MAVKGKKEFHEHAKKKQKELRRGLENEEKLTAKDYFAMLSSAYLVIFPICVLLLAALSLLVLWIFGAI